MIISSPSDIYHWIFKRLNIGLRRAIKLIINLSNNDICRVIYKEGIFVFIQIWRLIESVASFRPFFFVFRLGVSSYLMYFEYRKGLLLSFNNSIESKVWFYHLLSIYGRNGSSFLFLGGGLTCHYRLFSKHSKWTWDKENKKHYDLQIRNKSRICNGRKLSQYVDYNQPTHRLYTYIHAYLSYPYTDIHFSATLPPPSLSLSLSLSLFHTYIFFQ